MFIKMEKMDMKTMLFIIIGIIGALIQLSARIIMLPAAEFEVARRTLDTSTYAPFSYPLQQFEPLIARANPQHPFYLAEMVTNATGILKYTYFTTPTLVQILRPGMNTLNPVNHEPIIRINSYRFNTPWLPVFERTIHFAQPAGSGHHVSHISPNNHTPSQENHTNRTTFAQALSDKLEELRHRK